MVRLLVALCALARVFLMLFEMGGYGRLRCTWLGLLRRSAQPETHLE